MAKWFLGGAVFAALGIYTNSNAWGLPAVFCAVTGFVMGFRNDR